MRTLHRLPAVAVTCVGLALVTVSATGSNRQSAPAAPPALFQTSDVCVSCHAGLVTAAGEDVSFGAHWRPTMMANAARDPYWHAAVRREVLDHAESRAVIEDECAACHMPMARQQARAGGHEGEVFAHVPAGRGTLPQDVLAADGVSCTACHQIQDEKLGRRETANGGMIIDRQTPAGRRAAFGPFAVGAGLARVMRSATGFEPTESAHIRRAELCAGCHTLYTDALGADGKVTGSLPEQVPYVEWLHSDYRATRSCQSCHMPVVEGEIRISSVLGTPRAGVARHNFVGGNFFVPLLLAREAAYLGVQAEPQELNAAVARTLEHLHAAAASISIDRAVVENGRLEASVSVRNLSGHKLPTAYPSRRAWLHVTLRDGSGRALLESGAPRPDGGIAGNDNDSDAARFEPHHDEISNPDAVQIYEAIMADANGQVTTGLLKAIRYVKDNRLLPAGFDKTTAHADVAVHGGAADDADFAGGGDAVRYVARVEGAQGPFRVEVELCYQPIAHRWALNLQQPASAEADRFLSAYRDMAHLSTTVLARRAVTVGEGGQR